MPNTPLERYKYSISDIILTGESFEEPIKIRQDFVRSICIIKDYDNTISPKVQLIFQCYKEDYENIILNMDTLTASFKLYKTNIGEIDQTIDADTTTDIEQNHLYEDLTLKALNEDNISTENKNKLTDDSEYVDDTVDNSQQTALITLLLYDAEKTEKYKRNSYYILNGGKNDLIYNFFRDRDMSNILMATTDNISDTYKIPFGHLGNNLTLLNRYYGIYDTPYLFFMDFSVIYLIEKGNLGATLRPNELSTVSIYLEKESDSGYIRTGSYCDNDDNMYITNTSTFDIIDNDTSLDYVYGSNITTVISGSGEVTHDVIGNTKVEKTYTVENNKHKSQLLFSIKEKRRQINIFLSSVDLDIITPNKRYRVIPDETFYTPNYNIKGDYRLSSLNILLKRTSESEFNSSIQLLLNKIE